MATTHTISNNKGCGDDFNDDNDVFTSVNKIRVAVTPSTVGRSADACKTGVRSKRRKDR
jgi:hypothetical protein